MKVPGIERIWNWGVYRVRGWLDEVHVRECGSRAASSPPSAAPRLHFTKHEIASLIDVSVFTNET
ncbi:hypothetical protein BYT27DRAFT_7185047 [Phlegmacium glaucopus]|nr:hypothetical protein BYT27DRAFT_7185047 [Phlegmacium glaucopus]